MDTINNTERTDTAQALYSNLTYNECYRVNDSHAGAVVTFLGEATLDHLQSTTI